MTKDINDLHSTINHLDLSDICGTLHPATAERTFFPSSHGTFTKIDHVLDHEIHLIILEI